MVKESKEDKIIKIVGKRNLKPQELEKILKSVENSPPHQIQTFQDYFESKTRIGVFSDCHIGALPFDEPFFKHMAKTMKKQKVSRIYQCGDILEGMSGRPGHVYEMSQIGFNNQIDKAEEMFGYLKGVDVFGIDGNHDAWFQKKNNAGVIVGKELERRVPNYTHLGQEEADIKLKKGITMKIFHPNDGTAYAISYKMQKLMESFTGGEKPNILLQGHYHKALYMFNRNIHGVECGTMCGQTKWMRGRKIPAHKGFWIIDMEMGRGGIGSFKPAFYPGYK